MLLLLVLLGCSGKPEKPGDTGGPSGCAPSTWYADLDEDGYGDPDAPVEACEPPHGEVAEGGDCDDADASVHPGAEEECTSTTDLDCDGEAGDPDADGDGWVACLDCDDADATARPDAIEFCDGADDDCDGAVDEDASDGLLWYADADGDGHGDREVEARACSQPAGFVAAADDCDDADAGISPDAVETCDERDDDCDGTVDEDDAADVLTWYIDDDGDGFGVGEVEACGLPDGASATGGDCDDAADTVNPGATELCNGTDDDCDGLVDDDDDTPADASLWYADLDGDGYAGGSVTTLACAEPAGYSAVARDCDDADASVSPDAMEVCGGGDEDCDGTVDETNAIAATEYWWDADGDGHGDHSRAIHACSIPPGFAVAGDDCDDTSAAVSPSAAEVCDGVDDDCDGVVDEDSAVDAGTWYADLDGDSFGDATDAMVTCTAPGGYVADPGDCDDADATISPADVERCDGADDDCDAAVDEADAIDASEWYLDGDADGFGDSSLSQTACDAPAGHVALGGDCDDADAGRYPSAPEDCASGLDTNCDGLVGDADADGDGWSACVECDDADAAINPSATEVCNGADDDCDGAVDEDPSLWYADADGDGYGDPSLSSSACAAPPGYVADATDCDDRDASVSPAGTESCATEADDDCDGGNNDENAAGCTRFYYDLDGDGWGNTAWECLCEGEGSAVAAANSDCDDGDASVHPEADEQWGNGVDDDCEGTTDQFDLSDADYELLGSTAYDYTGSAVAAAGDVNGDGQDDVLVGAYQSDVTGSTGGLVYVVLGPVTGDEALTGEVMLRSVVAQCQVGRALDGGGDVDADGIDDIVIGAPIAEGVREGKAYVVHGPITTSGSLLTADGIWTGVAVDDYAGFAVSMAGDTDADGQEDVLVGAYKNDDAGSSAGAAYLLRGPASGTSALGAADATFLGEVRNDFAGYAVAGGGDLDGDGFDDILVGAYGRDHLASSAGAVYVVLGPMSGTMSLAAADATWDGEGSSDAAGKAVDIPGDMDGDGLADALVSAPNGGHVYLLTTPGTGTSSLANATATLEYGTSSANFGEALSGAGDVDADGNLDVLIGEDESDFNGYYSGAAWLALGPIRGSESADDVASVFYGAATGDHAGSAVSGAGDIDGDGLDDFLIGAHFGDGVVADAGLVHVYRGR